MATDPADVRPETLRAQIETFRKYEADCGWGGGGLQIYDTSDLCDSGQRAVRQFGEYVDGDSYLTALVEWHAKHFDERGGWDAYYKWLEEKRHGRTTA